MCIKDVKLPTYSTKEEIMNAITHGLGAIFAIVAFILMLIKVIPTHDVFRYISVFIYSLSLFITFLFSCLYHSLKRNNGKKVLRILDHNNIFLLVAGSYTPYTLVALREENIFNLGNGVVTYIMLIVVWLSCIVGLIFNSINIEKYKRLSMFCYLGAGWVIIVAIFPLWKVIGPLGVILLLLSGGAYTIGSIIYVIGKKIPYFHCIFHIFVLIAAVLMFLSIYLFVL